MGFFPDTAVKGGFYLWFTLLDVLQTSGWIALMLATPRDAVTMMYGPEEGKVATDTTLSAMRFCGLFVLLLVQMELGCLLLGEKVMQYFYRWWAVIAYPMMLTAQYLLTPLLLENVGNNVANGIMMCGYIYGGFIAKPKVTDGSGYDAVSGRSDYEMQNKGFLGA